MDNLKSKLINSYLEQQLQETCENKDKSLTIIEMPDNDSLEDFKNQVRQWVEIDNNIRVLKKSIKDQNTIKKDLNEAILRFMIRYNIEDLNTKDGSKLRYKVNQVKCKPTVSDMKTRLIENYDKVKSVEELTDRIFVPTKESKKATLRRLNVK
jgi:hypothetical protein